MGTSAPDLIQCSCCGKVGKPILLSLFPQPSRASVIGRDGKTFHPVLSYFWVESEIIQMCLVNPFECLLHGCSDLPASPHFPLFVGLAALHLLKVHPWAFVSLTLGWGDCYVVRSLVTGRCWRSVT